MLTETVTVHGEGVSVDLIVWRRYKRPMIGLVEQTLDINPGLAGLGPILPVGTVLKLPVVKPPAVRELAGAVRLWE